MFTDLFGDGLQLVGAPGDKDHLHFGLCQLEGVALADAIRRASDH